jgi:chromosomal replication initiation ATPase DnaA
MNDIWENIKAELKNQIPDHSFKMWIEPLVFENSENNTMVISAPNFFFQETGGGLLWRAYRKRAEKCWGKDQPFKNRSFRKKGKTCKG